MTNASDTKTINKIHLVEYIHQKIVTYQVAAMYFFIVIAYAVLKIMSPAYFTFEGKFTVMGVTTDSEAVKVAILIFFLYDRLLCNLSDEIQMRGVKGDKDMTPHAVFLNDICISLVTIVVNVMRYAMLIIFIKAQFSFAFFIVLFDVTACALVKYKTVAFNGVPWVFENANLSLYVCMFEIAEIPMFLLIFQICGLFNGAYFDFGPPLVVFDETISHTATIVLIVILVFVDRAIQTAYTNNIDSWFHNKMQHTRAGKDEIGLGNNEMRYVYITREIMYWLRISFVINFLFAKYYFVFVYIAAEIIPTCIYIARKNATKTIFDKFDNEETKFQYEPVEEGLEIEQLASGGVVDEGVVDKKKQEVRETKRRILMFASIQLIETVYIIIIIVVPNWIKTMYFRWPSFIVIFDYTITNQRIIIFLLVYVVFDRVSATLYNNIILPDINNWLYRKGHHLGYNVVETMGIIITSRVVYWFRFILLIQFVLANIFFVITAAVVDIPLTIIVMERYIKYKTRKHRVDTANNSVKNFLSSKKK